MGLTLGRAANGFRTIELGDLPETHWEELVLLLVEVYHFSREGPEVVGLDEAIAPSFHRADMTLLAGWDIWSGYYLMAECAVGDEFLEATHRRLESAAT